MVAVRPLPRELVGRAIRLVPLERDDAAELFEAIARPEVFAGGYGGGPRGLATTPDGWERFASLTYPWDHGIVYGARVVGGPADGMLVGTSSLADFDERRESTHIGWTAWSPAVWSTAVNPEAKLLMLTEAFDHGFGRVKLQADVLNERSRAAILRLGATFEGILRREQPRADGSWRDTAVYSITVDEWPGVRDRLQQRVADATVPVIP